jgi:serine/threonine protein phosphatase 1
MFGLFTRERAAARGPKGRRAYAVGDIHGRLDLLDQLLAEIEEDLRSSRGPALLVFLGDLIDRGPQSAQVIERLRTYRREGVQPVFLLGNHEEVLLRIIDGDAPLIAKWRWFGGTECLMSYGVGRSALDGLDEAQALAVVRKAVPPEHVEFLRGFVDTCRFGDYLFVHAGIRPGVELSAQNQSDLRWIRDPFLADDTEHGFVVVHGHTISNTVEERSNRIGIDTGAYKSGVLTALVIDGEQRRFLNTAPDDALAMTPSH